MNPRPGARPDRHDARRRWMCGLGLMLVGTVLVVLPGALRLRRSLRQLASVRATYAQRMSWAGNKAELERRVREQEAALARLEARLVSAAEVADLTKAVNTAARATGCSLLSTHPAAPRVVQRTSPKDAGGQPNGPAFELVQWRVSVEVQGQYGDIVSLVTRLMEEPRRLRIHRLVLHASGDDREALRCELELAAYSVQPLEGKQKG